jgi:hypothetical protein
MEIIMKTLPSRIRTSGLRPRCTAVRARDGARCDKPEHDSKQSHRWSTRKTTQPPRKKFELRKAASDMINDRKYRKHLLQALRTRRLRPAVECMLWYYAVGKPIEHVEHSGTMSLEDELRALTPEECEATLPHKTRRFRLSFAPKKVRRLFGFWSASPWVGTDRHGPGRALC